MQEASSFYFLISVSSVFVADVFIANIFDNDVYRIFASRKHGVGGCFFPVTHEWYVSISGCTLRWLLGAQGVNYFPN